MQLLQRRFRRQALAATLLLGVLAPVTAAPTQAQPTSAVADRQHRAPADDEVVPAGPGRFGRTTTGVPRHVHALVARLHSHDRVPSRPTTAETKDVLAQTRSWFEKVSRGRQEVSYRVIPWVRVRTTSTALCSENDLSTVTRTLRKAGYDLTAYNRLVLVLPECSGRSTGQVGGKVTWIRERVPRLDTLVHELGHNLGLRHAFAYICSRDGWRVPLGGRCHGQEYGDLWDAMGISVRPYSVPVLKRLGWAGKVVDVRHGTYVLADAERSGSGIQGLRVRVDAHRSYWLEFHPETEVDPSDPDLTGQPGLQIRLDTGGPSMKLLDLTPGNPDPYLYFPDHDFLRVTMHAGTAFTTPEDIRIRVLEQTDSRLKVAIDRHHPDSAPGRPTLVGALEAEKGYEHDLYVRPGSSGGQLVLGYEVTRYPSGATSRYTLPEGNGVITLFGRLSHQYAVRAITQAGRSPLSRRVTLVPAGPVIDSVTPAEGTVHGHDVDLTVSVSPNPVSGSSISLVIVCELFDGQCDDYQQDGKAPYTFSYHVNSPRKVTYRVTATDKLSHNTTVKLQYDVLGNPPVLTVTSPAAGAVVERSFHVTGHVEADPDGGTGDPAIWATLLDSDGYEVAYTAGAGPDYDLAFTGIPEGTYRLEVTAEDPNGDRTVRSRTVTVVGVRPVVAITSPVGGAQLSGASAPVTVSVDHPERFDPDPSGWLLVDGSYAGYVDLGQVQDTGQLDLSGVAYGNHELTVQVNDAYYGSWQTDPVSFSYSG